MEKKGYFISFEGTDGCGKGTQIEKLKNYFEENNIDAVFTHEPGGVETADKIRAFVKDPANEDIDTLSDFLLISAGRNLHVKQKIKPALEQGKIVVTDRYVDSCYAYQGYAGGLELDMLKNVTNQVIQGIMPDITFFLSLDASASLERNKGLDDKLDKFELKGVSFQEKVRNGYFEMVKDEPNRWVVIDARLSREEIFDIIICELKNRGVIEC